MISLDTNVIVRFLVNDDPAQAAVARRLVEENDVFVCVTVVLELDWVLRSAYGFSRAEVADAIRAFAGLPGVDVESPHRVSGALRGASAGMDLADCLHVLAKSDVEFATFDRALYKKIEEQAIGNLRLL